MSRSLWAAALAVLAFVLAPGAALAAVGGSAHQQSQRVVVLGFGSGFPKPSGAVRSLQRRLIADGFSPGPVDGRFGPLTRAAVERFQRAAGLAVDGIVGARTRRGLAAGGLMPGAGWLQSRGSTVVRRLQRRLARAGFSPGQVDGRYGPRTRAAVARFQHARHFAATGVASAATLKALAGQRPKATPAPQSQPKPNPKGKQHPAAAKPKPAPKNTHPAPAKPAPKSSNPVPGQSQPAVPKASGFPWMILVLLGVLAAAALVLLAVRARKPSRRAPREETAAPQAYEPAGVSSPASEPGPAPVAARAVAAASEDPSVSAAEIAALEAAVAMPSAGSPRDQQSSANHEEVRETADTPAPVALQTPPAPEDERVERVRALQRQLTWLGFRPGGVDGRYGPATTEAIRAFQRVRGLPADGVADAATLTALRAGTPDRPFSGRAQRVKELQRELTLRGYAPGAIDGRYGPRTTDAVKRFQRQQRLPDDGVADQATLDALHGAQLTQPFAGRQERVKELQRQLTALGLQPGEIDGRYGPVTTEAVRRFQRGHDLPADGVADPVTLNALKSTITGSPFTARTQRVKDLQRQLHSLGFEPGLVDGRYGPLTTQAVKRFQQAHNLTANGIADPDTLHHLNQQATTTPQPQLTPQPD